MDEAPKDRMKLVALVCILHGMGVLISWNMFINAWDYFTEYKLCYMNSTTTVPSPYVDYFMQYLTFTSQFPNVIFTFVNAFVRIGGNLTLRILGSLLVVLAVFIFTLIMAFANTENKVASFFWATMISVTLMQVFNAIYQNSLLGMISILPPVYMGHIITGNNVCGTFASVTKLIAKAVGGSHKWTAIYYFSTAVFALGACFGTFFVIKLNKFYRFYLHHYEEQKGASISEDIQKYPYWRIMKTTSPQLYDVFMNFLITLACFPAILSNVPKSSVNFFITDDYYTDVMCFLNFNVFAMIGSIIAGFYIFPKPRYIWIPVTVRIILIPLFLFCNYQPPSPSKVRSVGVIIDNDYIYFILVMVTGLTCGYYASASMMTIPGMVELQYAHVAGMIGGVFLIFGIFVGIMLAFLWPVFMWKSAS